MKPRRERTKFTDIILVWVVERVDDGRLRGPFVLVDGLSKFGNVPLGLEVQDAEQVLKEGVVLSPQLKCFNKNVLIEALNNAERRWLNDAG